MDTSFLWLKPIARDVLSGHWESVSNLKRLTEVVTGTVFRSARPALQGLLTQLAWGAVTYFLAFVALRRRERS